tara:strand:- start:25 stop:309 length:285 start_codon:yes stop_codon:yes gene_type:complete
MWWILFIIFLLTSIISSVILYYALRRITQYENLITQFQQIISFSSEKMKLVDSKGHFESDDETGFFFEQLKELQILLDNIFEQEEEIKNAKKEK